MEEIKVLVEVTKYKTDDGKVFDTKGQAIHYERMRDGTRKVCKHCEGTGQVPSVDYRSFEPCNTCDGRGFLDKQEVWK